MSESAVNDDAPYASISSRKPSRDAEEIQYATVQHHKTKPTKKAEENENQYGNIRIHQPGAAVRCENTTFVIIYSEKHDIQVAVFLNDFIIMQSEVLHHYVYAFVLFCFRRSDVETVEDLSVIYSHVK